LPIRDPNEPIYAFKLSLQLRKSAILFCCEPRNQFSELSLLIADLPLNEVGTFSQVTKNVTHRSSPHSMRVQGVQEACSARPSQFREVCDSWRNGRRLLRLGLLEVSCRACHANSPMLNFEDPIYSF
jgi:hypothetical protein